MKKDFSLWTKEKVILQNTNPEEIEFKERDIWWCSIGENIGDEEDGKNGNFERPVLVIRKFNARIAWAIPMSSKIKENNPYYFTLSYKNGETYSLLLSQMRLVSIKRFTRFVKRVTPLQFQEVRSSLKALLP